MAEQICVDDEGARDEDDASEAAMPRDELEPPGAPDDEDEDEEEDVSVPHAAPNSKVARLRVTRHSRVGFVCIDEA